VIDEAVEMAKRFSTDDSGRFVNGVLSSIARELR
jgi:N utilization substance protein B